MSPIKRETNIPNNDLQAVKEELNLLREMFGSELRNVRKFIQDNQADFVKRFHTPSTTQATEGDKENTAVDNLKPVIFGKPFKDVIPNAMTPLGMAEKALIDAEHRRKNLEQNLATMQRSKQSQGVFDILKLLGQDDDAIERARIKALVNDAILNSHIKPEKKVVESIKKRVSNRLNDLSRPKQRQVPSARRPLQYGNKAAHPVSIIEKPVPQRLGLTSLIGSSLRNSPPPLHISRPAVRPLSARGQEQSKTYSPSPPAKFVHFNEDTPHEVLATPIQICHSPQKQNQKIVRSRHTLQPLGMRQYSMWPLGSPEKKAVELSPSSLGQFEDHLIRQQPRGTVFLQDLPQPPRQERELDQLPNTLLRRQVEEDVMSRLLRQLTTVAAPLQPQEPCAHDRDLRDLIEAALLERLQRGQLFIRNRIEPTSVTSRNVSLSLVSDTEPTIIGSPQRDIPSHSRTVSPRKVTPAPHISFRDRSASARPVSSHSSRHPAVMISRALSAQSLNSTQTPKPRHHSPSHTLNNLTSLSADNLNEKTLDDLPTDSRISSIQTDESKHWGSYGQQFPNSPDGQGDRTLTPASLNVGSRRRTGTPVDENNGNQQSLAPSTSIGSTTSMSDWSSTAPHSFSDGVWLEERSIGEQGRFRMDPQQAQLLTAKLGPLPIDSSIQSDSEISDSLMGTHKKTIERKEDESVATRSRDEFTVDRISKPMGIWIAPWRDPVLHLIALNASGKNSRLPWNRYVQVQRMAAALGKQGQEATDLGFTFSPDYLDREGINLGFEHCSKGRTISNLDASVGDIRLKSTMFVSTPCPNDFVSVTDEKTQSASNIDCRLAGTNNSNRNNTSTKNFASFLSAAQPFSDEEEDDEVTYTAQWDSSSSDHKSLNEHPLDFQTTNLQTDRSMTIDESVNQTFTITDDDSVDE